MVERSLSMREVPGSIPGASNIIILYFRYELQIFIKFKYLIQFDIAFYPKTRKSTLFPSHPCTI